MAHCAAHPKGDGAVATLLGPRRNKVKRSAFLTSCDHVNRQRGNCLDARPHPSVLQCKTLGTALVQSDGIMAPKEDLIASSRHHSLFPPCLPASLSSKPSASRASLLSFEWPFWSLLHLFGEEQQRGLRCFRPRRLCLSPLHGGQGSQRWPVAFVATKCARRRFSHACTLLALRSFEGADASL